MVGPAEEKELKALGDYAAQHPISFARLQKIKAGTEKPVGLLPSHNRTIPVGYRVTFSHETHPKTGLVRHVSIRIPTKNKYPNPIAVDKILEGLGFRGRTGDPFGRLSGDSRLSVWVDKAAEAINIVEQVEKGSA